ncbi:hypothetical protein BKA67DRAFT_569302 [Truncatella angustata]|uniref:Uncharacterized protein n=1 Tax=Truncatella angustata TaxID=152316 RepID=A0A9P8UJP6_9PEZI|nr:uncharacterized protein BKA67DRAFT_569302 [Truncatella angustata]KAH6653377.1 hypothetical protein BKA67DRAFT_569302 [Truncatella angustata]
MSQPCVPASEGGLCNLSVVLATSLLFCKSSFESLLSGVNRANAETHLVEFVDFQ